MGRNSSTTALEIAPHKFKATLPAEDASALGRRVAELISPFTEFGGLIGDYIHFFRQRSAIRALNAAHKLAKKKGLNLRPVPPKFLVAWSEAASLEDDSSVTKLWANLLVGATQHEENCKPIFVDILRRLTPADVKILESLWRKWSKDTAAAMMIDTHRVLLRMAIGGYCTEAKRKAERKSGEEKHEFVQKYIESRIKRSLKRRGWILGTSELKFEDTFSFILRLDKEKDAIFAVFRHLQILDEDEFLFQSELGSGNLLRARFYCLSPFGFQFLQACHSLSPGKSAKKL